MQGSGNVYTATQKRFYVPDRDLGWRVVVRPGFAHESVPVTAWRLVLDAASGETIGREPLGFSGAALPRVGSLRQPKREGSFLLSLGVEIEGERWDLAPLLWDLLRRDARWLDARQIALIDDRAIITLRAPGGRRVEAPAAPLKAIVGTMVDLLSGPEPAQGPLRLSAWDLHRLDDLRAGLLGERRAHAIAGIGDRSGPSRIDRHGGRWLGVIFADRGGSHFDVGRHVKYEKDTPMTNLYLSVLCLSTLDEASSTPGSSLRSTAPFTTRYTGFSKPLLSVSRYR